MIIPGCSGSSLRRAIAAAAAAQASSQPADSEPLSQLSLTQPVRLSRRDTKLVIRVYPRSRAEPDSELVTVRLPGLERIGRTSDSDPTYVQLP